MATTSHVADTGADALFDGFLHELDTLRKAIEKALTRHELPSGIKAYWTESVVCLDDLDALARCEGCQIKAAVVQRPGDGVFCAACAAERTDCTACRLPVRHADAVTDEDGHPFHQACYGESA